MSEKFAVHQAVKVLRGPCAGLVGIVTKTGIDWPMVKIQGVNGSETVDMEKPFREEWLTANLQATTDVATTDVATTDVASVASVASGEGTGNA